jgi:hypothetical protein
MQRVSSYLRIRKSPPPQTPVAAARHELLVLYGLIEGRFVLPWRLVFERFAVKKNAFLTLLPIDYLYD